MSQKWREITLLYSIQMYKFQENVCTSIKMARHTLVSSQMWHSVQNDILFSSSSTTTKQMCSVRSKIMQGPHICWTFRGGLNLFFTPFAQGVFFKYTISSNHNILITSRGLCFWTPDPLIDKS